MLRQTGKVLLTVGLGVWAGLAGSAPAAAGGPLDPPKARLAVRMHVATPALVEVVIGGLGATGAATPGAQASGPTPSPPPEPAPAAPGSEDLLLQARAAARDGRWPESLAAYRQILQTVPDHPQRDLLSLETAGVLEHLDRDDEALTLYDRILAGNPDPELAARARRGRTVLFFRRPLPGPDPLAAFASHARELIALSVLEHLSPDDRDLLQRTAVQAWDRLLAALQAHPDLPVARLEELISLWDQTPAAWRPPAGAVLWADRLHRAGLFSEAARFYQAALEAGDAPARPLLWPRLADALRELGDWRRLETALTAWRQEAGDLPPRRLAELGRVQLMNGAAAPAVATLEAALAQDEAAQSPDNWLALAQGHQQLRDEPQAIKVLERALLRPLPREALHKQLAALYDRAGSYDQAAALYQKLLELAVPADRAFFLERLGVCYAKTQQYSQAHQIFRELAGSADGFWQKLAQAHLQDLAVSSDSSPGLN